MRSEEIALAISNGGKPERLFEWVAAVYLCQPHLLLLIMQNSLHHSHKKLLFQELLLNLFEKVFSQSKYNLVHF